MSEIDRRQFIGSAGASAVFSIVPGHVLGGAGHVAPSDKITLAHIGMGTQGFEELGNLLADPRIQIVAVCDPNTDSSDKPWRAAFLGGPQSLGSFLNAGPVSDTVNLGTIALRTGDKVMFDSGGMKITNIAEANKYMYRDYRKGWEL